ncbi:Adenosylcobinamide-phosphate synthase [Alloactinosynnema sp. L-07]|uniref:cobalamin biosynthesis protein n=1 Tax=Alloactinosynnema sp. L-07 TaxID=1653480 RepID=UPI00065F0327|nr:cobalamin biosynthesis protein [Alloactinosynnema sp. L-07]CRK61820.1 Adenosylcobinamide-phosphate synthase [Alloactinosynnema sp. L-07]
MGSGRAIGLLLGVAADAIVGDPRRFHPVAGFGTLAGRLEKAVYRDHRVPGAVYTAVLAGGAVALGMAVERRSPILGTALATWAVLGGRSLATEGALIGRHLDEGALEDARTRIPHLCGRDPSTLDGPAMARATVESVAENTSDAVVAPLFWGAVAGVPGLLGYRAINTMDAMVGHRSPRYHRFGWASARLDDLVNLVPARLAAALTVAAAPVVGGDRRGAWTAWQRDASAHPSPNAGRVEAAFAGALEVRLGGRTVYPYGVEDRPVLGTGRMPDAGHVTRAVELSRVVGALTAAVAAVIAFALGMRRKSRSGA